MQKIEAYIKPFRSEAVRKALQESGIRQINIFEVQGTLPDSHKELYRGNSYEVDYTPLAVLTMIVENDQTESTVNIIREHAVTGNDGDGKIVILPVDQVVAVDVTEPPPV